MHRIFHRHLNEPPFCLNRREFVIAMVRSTIRYEIKCCTNTEYCNIQNWRICVMISLLAFSVANFVIIDGKIWLGKVGNTEQIWVKNFFYDKLTPKKIFLFRLILLEGTLASIILKYFLFPGESREKNSAVCFIPIQQIKSPWKRNRAPIIFIPFPTTIAKSQYEEKTWWKEKRLFFRPYETMCNMNSYVWNGKVYHIKSA